MATWNSRGLRGSTLEDMINRTNDQYREQGLALIQKIPTPITPVRMDKETRRITLAYFDQKSTIDYIGAVQGIPVCFDAKECKTDTFPLANIHPHQIRFMADFEKQNGISFLLIFYSSRDEYYYLRYEELLRFWNRMEAGGLKRFHYEELTPAFFLRKRAGVLVPYLDGIQRDLSLRDEEAGAEKAGAEENSGWT
ncbi:MAG: Holliday junction resolvase RecU [Bilifractor sp.]|jgi:recombination protein U|nr:Holliday junction resolvase RecU [Lachnospiraceae bacterium]MDY2837623.1 Holliday junction resolvase RecU [Bilifractor sp.]